ncbi:hypothetical protein SGPA1_40021 [Streptomyces misionensis JCM 4497]
MDGLLHERARAEAGLRQRAAGLRSPLVLRRGLADPDRHRTGPVGAPSAGGQVPLRQTAEPRR